MDGRNHQAIRHSQGLWNPASPLGGRTNIRLARSLQAARQRRGKVHSLVNSVDFDRLNPHADPQNRKALSVLKNFRIRL